MKTKSFNELRKKMTPQQRAESRARTQLALLHLTLSELGNLNSQDEIALLDIVESALADVECQDDIQVSALSRYVKSLGGSLKIIACFPDREVVLSQFDCET